MRIAFSGSHRVGKSTLVRAIAEALPNYTTVDEPYYLLEEEGYEVGETPSLEDFEAQLERSIAEIEESEENTLFDRCPADVLAYLLTHEDADSFEADAWLERVRAAMDTLDFVVFVPIEQSDRIAIPAHEDGAYRLIVDEKLHEILVDDALGLGPEVMMVEGNVKARVDQVIKLIIDVGENM